MHNSIYLPLGSAIQLRIDNIFEQMNRAKFSEIVKCLPRIRLAPMKAPRDAENVTQKVPTVVLPLTTHICSRNR